MAITKLCAVEEGIMSAPLNGNIGIVYLLHFDRPLGRARHYLGWTSLSLEERLARHNSNDGAAILRAIKQVGIGYSVAAVYENVDRHFERKLKNKKAATRWCPMCKENHSHQLLRRCA